MNQDTLKQLTIATDTAMTRILQNRLDILSSETPPEEVGRKLMEAQLALDRMGSDQPPDYDDEWLALLYLAWYGPSHINLAYTLFTEAIPQHDNTLDIGPSGVHLEDFACGSLAGQFGLVLAAAGAAIPFSADRRLSIYSDDISDPMWALGRDFWKGWREEIGALAGNTETYPELDSVRDAALSLRIKQRTNPSAPVWLTIFHGAYPGKVGQALRDRVAELVQRNQPRLILATSHPNRRDDIYIAPLDSYKEVARWNEGPTLTLLGNFEQVTKWRRRLADQLIIPVQARIEDFEEWEHERVRYLLTEKFTLWSPSHFRYVYSLYVRQDA